MEHVSLWRMDTRMPGVGGIFAGILMFILLALVLIYDLVLPGGHVVGSQNQNIVIMVFLGSALIASGYLEYQGKA